MNWMFLFHTLFLLAWTCHRNIKSFAIVNISITSKSQSTIAHCAFKLAGILPIFCAFNMSRNNINTCGSAVMKTENNDWFAEDSKHWKLRVHCIRIFNLVYALLQCVYYWLGTLKNVTFDYLSCNSLIHFRNTSIPPHPYPRNSPLVLDFNRTLLHPLNWRDESLDVVEWTFIRVD